MRPIDIDNDLVFTTQGVNSASSNYQYTRTDMTATGIPVLTTQALTGGASMAITVWMGGLNITGLAGPSPMVEMSLQNTLGTDGVVDYTTQTITLTGKIIRLPTNTDPDGDNYPLSPPDTGRGLQGLLNAVQSMNTGLAACGRANFKIMCGTTEVFVASGARVVSTSYNPSDDHWVKTVDYTIGLEYIIPATGNAATVTDRSDTWSIEPQEDIQYSRFNAKVFSGGETISPLMQRIVPQQNAPVPGNAFLGSMSGGSRGTEIELQIINIPQFRITRRLSAKGVLAPLSGVTGCYTTGEAIQAGNMRWIAAQSWVNAQLATSFAGSHAAGSPYFGNDVAGQNKIFLYNHARSINIDRLAGSYESNDSWLALPVARGYSDSFTVEGSTSAEFLKTVRVNGNVVGYQNSPTGIMAGTTGSLVKGTGTGVTGLAAIDLSYSLTSSTGGAISYDLPHVSGVVQTNTLLTSRYENALSGWLSDIKPYVYRRACLAMNSKDRIQAAVQTTSANPIPLQNPVFVWESVLNPIPVSTSEGHDPIKGTISYSHEYNSRINLISGVLSENISLKLDAPADNVSETQVIGRQLGPILTKSGRTSSKKSLSIEVVVKIPRTHEEMWVNNTGCPLYTGGYVYTTIATIIEGVRPFGSIVPKTSNNEWFGAYATNKKDQGIVFLASDQESWSPSTGRFNRNVSWVFQNCANTGSYLDH